MKKKKVIALLLATSMMSMESLPVFADGISIISTFKDPDVYTKPMARYWFPDAAATYEQLEAEMTELYNAGYGGVELAFFPGITSFDNAEYGWGTENWRSIMKNMLKIAASFEDGFIVDFTITSGWPVATNDIDPNDEAADKELVSAIRKVTDSSSVMELPMSEILAKDSFGNPFIRTNNLVGTVTGKVTAIDENGKLTIDSTTVQKLQATATGKTTMAGIPSVEGLDENSDEYQYILGLYEGEAPDTSIYFTDSMGRPVDIRTARDDVQEYWQTDLSTVDFGEYAPSEGDEIAVGDYVVYAFYERGTGRTIMDMGNWAQYENPLPTPSYETSMYSASAVTEIAEFLDKTLFCDEELVSLMKETATGVGGAIFEDSLENEYKGIAWTSELADTFQTKTGYDIIPSLIYITGDAASTEGNESNYQEDYNAVINDMYLENHLAHLQSYINEKTGFNYRVQAYHTRKTKTHSKLDTSAASAIADLAEGESLAFGSNYDSYRYITGGVHIAGKKQISSESFAIQDGSAYNLTWDRVTKIMNGMFAAGVNKVIFHGTSLDSSNANNGEFAYSNNWPGWSAFNSICTDDWDGRMPYFQDVNILTDYISRNEAVLLNGTAKVDLLVYDLNGYDYSTRKEDGDNSAFKVLLDAGYTYDNVMTDALMLDNLSAENGILCTEGPSYKAIVVNDLVNATSEALGKLLSFAEAGVPVIFYKSAPTTAISVTETDDAIQTLADQIMATGNGYFAQSQIEIQNILAKQSILPNASYLKSDLRVATREDTDGSMYYYLYNNSGDEINVEINLKGNGDLYLMNAWNGEIMKTSSTENGDYVLANLHFDPYETTVAAVTTDTADFPGEIIEVAPTKADKPINLDNWNLSIESWGPETDTDIPADTRKVNLEVGDVTLDIWDNYSAPAEQLAQTGVESLADVSGIGYYKTEVDLSELENVKGGKLVLNHGKDMITSITVNGQEITNLNPINNSYELGEALISGVNTIEVKLSTTIINRARIENDIFGRSAKASYGITSATLIPYIG